jgi:hypothetical protein
MHIDMHSFERQKPQLLLFLQQLFFSIYRIDAPQPFLKVPLLSKPIHPLVASLLGVNPLFFNDANLETNTSEERRGLINFNIFPSSSTPLTPSLSPFLSPFVSQAFFFQSLFFLLPKQSQALKDFLYYNTKPEP